MDDTLRLFGEASEFGELFRTLGLPVFLIFMIWLPLRGLSALVRRGRELPAPRESHFRNPRPL